MMRMPAASGDLAAGSNGQMGEVRMRATKSLTLAAFQETPTLKQLPKRNAG